MRAVIVLCFVSVYCFSVADSSYSCKNKKPLKQCSRYAARGKCDGNLAWRKWMRKYCHNTCGCEWCKDFRKDCGSQKWKCGSTLLEPLENTKTWMFKNCRKTCGCQLSSECGLRSVKRARRDLSSILSILLDENNDENMKLVGGKNAKRGQYPWQVGIWTTPVNDIEAEGPFCSGTLITHNAIVTAAHCFKRRFKPADYYVRLGDLNTKKWEVGEVRRYIKKIILHKNFILRTFANDIALIILTVPIIRFNQFIRPACIPEKRELPRNCRISGWGKTSEGPEGKRPDILQHVRLPIVPYQKCNTAYKALFYDRSGAIITNSMVCAGHDEGGKDACQYDSGGPLSCKVGRRFFLSGIVSFGSGCARARSYGVYTNVYNYIHWIRRNLEWQF